MTSVLQNFLDTFVAPEKQDEARTEMQEIFASMTAELARDMFRNFKGCETDSDSDEKPKKKRAASRKKDEEKVERPICTGLTAAGKPCKNKVSLGEDGTCEELCHIHLKKKNDPPAAKKEKVTKPKKEKVTKSKKVKKTKKTPEHNHELTEEDTSDCELCESHGNKTAVDGFEEEFVLDGDTKSTLEAILAKASDSDEETDVEEGEELWLAKISSEGDMPDLDELDNSPPRTRASSKNMHAV